MKTYPACNKVQLIHDKWYNFSCLKTGTTHASVPVSYSTTIIMNVNPTSDRGNKKKQPFD